MRVCHRTWPAQVLVVLGLVVPGIATAQVPAFLDLDEPTARAETPHIVAVAEAVPVEMVRDDRVTLRLRVMPRPGMRVYAHDVTGYVPFSIALDQDPRSGVTADRVDWPEVALYAFPPTGESSRVYDGQVVVRQVVALGPKAHQTLDGGSGVTVRATIRYQACDDRLCYRPATARVAWTIPPPARR